MENQKSAPVYQVVEKFVSINGEGRRAGELAVFIRMKGCNLHCSYCDTYWANESDCESTEMTADEIISYIEESRIRNITLTGGEPLLREGMTQLIRAILQDPQRRVEIETNGSIDLTPYCNLERRPSFTMDYKMPESGMEHAMLLANMEKLSDESCRDHREISPAGADRSLSQSGIWQDRASGNGGFSDGEKTQ